MTLKEVKSILEQTKFPVAYRFFKKPQKPPFICYLSPYNVNMYADGIVWQQIKHIEIELYTDEKDTEAEDKVEKALSSFCWRKTENYIDSEKLYQIIYEIEV